MYIKIELKEKGTPAVLVEFPITLKDLENAVQACYLNLGTMYKPIAVDNFVTLGGNEFPTIIPNTKLSIGIKTDKGDKECRAMDPQLLCCKVKNVGKSFNDGLTEIHENHWKNIFDCKGKHIFAAPDGTLYISPDKDNVCHIATQKKVFDAYVSYSILFSLLIEYKEGHQRRYYFLLDPLVQVSSGVGSGSK